MQQMLHTTKRAVSVAVAAATIAFTVGLAGLVAPSRAAAASAGDLIKGSLSTVYYYGYDGMRYTFPNEKTYMTWYSDFSDVTTISDSSLADLELAGNVVYRAGSKFVKITSDPKVYAVSTSGAIHWIESADVAVDYAGSDWATTNVQDVPDAFFADYTVGASLMTATAFDGAMYMDGGSYYINVNGEKRMVSSAGRSANNMQAAFFMDGTGIDDSALTAGADITVAITGLMDPAQTESVVSEVTGGLTISSSSSTPGGASLPQGANSVEVFSFDVDAGSSDASLDGLVLSLTGAGATTDISNVYIYDGSTRLTEARSVNASTREVTFSTLNYDLSAGDSATLTVRIEASATAVAADTFGFSIVSADSITASGDVSGSFPISGNTFSFTGSDAGSLLITKSGSITNPTLGEQDAVIGMFKAAASSEAATITSVMLKVDNASDHSDFWLWDGSVALVEGTNTSGDFVMFDLSAAPFEITDGGSNVFSVSADIGGQSADAVKVYIDNAADLVAIGGDFGFGMTIDTGATSGTYNGTSCTSTSGNCSYSTLQGGDLTITSSGPTAGDVQVNSQDVSLLNMTITSGEELTIKDLDIILYGDDAATLDGDAFDADGQTGNDDDDEGLINGNDDADVADTGDAASLTDIKIINVDTGAVVMGPLELDNLTADDTQTIDFTDDWTLAAGEVINLMVTADIDNGTATGTAFGASFDVSGLSAEDANGDTLATTSIVPSGDITGYNQVARSASLVIALASTPGDVTSVDGSNGVLVNAFTFVAGTASDLHVSSIKLSGYADEDGTPAFTAGDVSGADLNDFIESCSLTDSAGNALGTAASFISTGISVTMNDVDWDIAAGASEVLKVYCDFANVSDTTDTNYFAFDLADLSEDVVVEDEDSNDVDATTDAPNGGTTPTNVVTLAAAGSLAATAGSSTPQADFVLTSSSSNYVATYRYTATNEAFEIQTVSFSEEQAEDETGTSESSAYANNISLVTITYPLVDGTTGTSSAAMTGNEAKFTGIHAYVAVDEPADIDVYVNVPSTARDAGGSATSNEKIRMGWFIDATGDDNFKAVGTGSGSTFTDTSCDGAGTDCVAIGDDSFATDAIATFVVRETKPTFSVSSSSPSGASVPGLSEVLRFNVAAASNEDVVLEQLMFKLTSTDIAGSDWNVCDTNAAITANLDESEFEFYNLTKSSSTQLDTADTNWTEFSTTGAVCDTTAAEFGYMKLTLPTAEVIPAGSTYSYSLKVDTTSASASSDDAFRIDIVNEPATTFLTASTDESPATIAIAATTFTPDTIGGYYQGDIICFTGHATEACSSTDERALVVACTGGSTTTTGGLCTSGDLTIIRGYLGSVATATASGAAFEIDVMRGSMLWQDDGSTAEGTTTQTRWGGYLVDALSLTGGTLIY